MKVLFENLGNADVHFLLKMTKALGQKRTIFGDNEEPVIGARIPLSELPPTALVTMPIVAELDRRIEAIEGWILDQKKILSTL